MKSLIAIYNINGFFNPLQTMIDHKIEEGFIDPKYRALATVMRHQGIINRINIKFQTSGYFVHTD